MRMPMSAIDNEGKYLHHFNLLRAITSTVIFAVLVSSLSACSPTIYNAPAKDFHAATTSLRDTYFAELDISNQAVIERGDLEDQIQIWLSPVAISTDELDRISKRMTERRNEDIHDQLKPIREQAFKALEGYASTLMSLSANEQTERIQSEITGLAKDITTVLDNANKLSLVGAELEKLKNISGPLQQYVEVLNQVIGLVSDIVRERAIIETIGKSNEPINKLLVVLKDDALLAENNAQGQMKQAKENIARMMSNPRFQTASNDLKAAIAKRSADIETIEARIAGHNIASMFDAGIRAQGALVEKATLRDPGDWSIKIRRFKEQVIATKAAIERTRAEM